ncbi:exodeoxyribonuclease VII large subunit [Terrihabitans rhizophilus]|uniref:Exodeoxyribonuclease 7 large subunit n=1 Tax=Terrihabitans rhizophilus TaxID=3092662 RepID=A0ABU4RRV3_9HYPH|nr:exodeoxyribonuclease VII large subunit [Terrihabitans sp. PJ23]MDX6806883.1 exodeoxyribonuclease VII large subunit [Terrihabitans sp. PJ23]
MPGPESAPSNAPEITVSELSASLKRTIEDAFGYVRVRGEISGYRGPHSSGHAYFCLKDESARIDAVVWKTTFSRMKFKPEEGLEVIATGKLTTFAGKSSYQIVVDSIAPAGVGALMALLEERRRKLAAEGLFDASRKRPIPFLPQTIGVVTSPTGAVIRDILHRLADRFPRRVIVWPVRVQGETSAAEVAAAIRGFNALPQNGPVPRPDVLIVARGGGSLEDLWGFNEEAVVRAAAESTIPLISAVGHETDTTLIDFAADVRAPTPTGAAEMAVPVRSELLAGVGACSARMLGALGRLVNGRRTELRSAARALPSAEALLATPRQRLDILAGRLAPALVAHERNKRILFSQAAARLQPSLVRSKLERRAEQVESLHRHACRALKSNTQTWRQRLSGSSARLKPEALLSRTARCGERLQVLASRKHLALTTSTRAWRRRFDVSETRLTPALAKRGLADQARRLDAAFGLLRAFSYQGTLERGFAVVLDGSGGLIRLAAAVGDGEALTLRFADGEVPASAKGPALARSRDDLPRPAPEPLAPARPARAKRVPAEQDDLFG